jgi:surfactin synthase thioesterase subunit
VYRAWSEELPDEVEVRTVLLPGRESRFAEPAVPSVEELADRIVQGLGSRLDPPFAIFGHSLGGLIGYEVASRLAASGRPPRHLLVSGARAPHLRHPDPVYHMLPDAEFAASVSGLGGTPSEVLANRELIELMLPTLRADFRAAETYRRQTAQPLPCPITAFLGADDDLIERPLVDAWSESTSSRFRIHVLPGDHFFLNASRPALVRLVAEELAPYLR